MDTEERQRRVAIVVEECGGVLPYAYPFYDLSIEYSARAAVAAFMRYGESIAIGDADAVASDVHEGLNHCASLSRFFWPPSKSSLAQARAAKLRERYAVDDGSPLKNRSLRNGLEHFDERLDDFLLTDAVGYILPQAMLGSHSLADDPVSKVFKLVDTEAEVFVLFNKKYQFAPLSYEASRILLMANDLA